MIPILLDDSKALTSLVSDTSNGLGRLSECSEAIVTEERNGAYTLEFTIPVTAIHFSDIHIGGLVKCSVNELDRLQIFRIEKMSAEMNGLVTCSCNHISYDLSKSSVLPFTSTGAVDACNAMISHMAAATAFTMTTDIANNSSSFQNSKPQSMRALLGGQDGSMLDVFGGELKWDNLAVSLLANRGTDKSDLFRIAYGKNLTNATQEKSIENTYTAVMPFASDSDGTVTTGDLQTITDSDYPKVLNLDLSSKFTDADGNAITITVALLNQYAHDYITINNVGVPSVNVDVSFVNAKDLGLPQLETVGLCDTVTVQYKKLGIDVSAKVIEVEWNVLLDRTESITLGDAKSHLEDTIYEENAQNTADATNKATSFMAQQVALFSQLISNGLGLFNTKVEIAGGGTQYYLHNKPTLADSNIQYTINANGFAVSNDYGATWSAGIDSDGNAVFNALAANTIKALSIYGSTIQASTMIFGEDDTKKITVKESTLGEGGIRFKGGGDFTVETATLGLTGTGSSDGTREVQIVGKDGNGNTKNYLAFTDESSILARTNVCYLAMSDTAITLRFGNAVTISLSESNGLGIYFNGSGYSNLGFVNDGSGHVVLGK